jgi:hypothetical protein
VLVADPVSAGLECWSSYTGKASSGIKGRAPCGGKLVRYEGDGENLFPFGPVVGKHMKDKYVSLYWWTEENLWSLRQPVIKSHL